MDEIVRQALSKWPNVPHCCGWLRLDARGHWRMRDERAQQLDLPGDKIGHPALLGFINRNYQCDAGGQWYFQNGPQRVYVDLEATPYIVRIDPQAGLLLHTGSVLPPPQQAWLTPQGQFILQASGYIAALDDRDATLFLNRLQHAHQPAAEECILAWLDGDDSQALQLHYGDLQLPLQSATLPELAQQLHFVTRPRATAG